MAPRNHGFADDFGAAFGSFDQQGVDMGELAGGHSSSRGRGGGDLFDMGGGLGSGLDFGSFGDLSQSLPDPNRSSGRRRRGGDFFLD